MATAAITFTPEIEILRLLTHEGPLTVAELCERSPLLRRGIVVRSLTNLVDEECVVVDGVRTGVAHRPASLFRATDLADAYLRRAQQSTWSPGHAVLALLARQGRSSIGDLIEGSRDDPFVETLTRRVLTRAIKSLTTDSHGGEPLVEIASDLRREPGRPAARLYELSPAGRLAVEAARVAASNLVKTRDDPPD